MAIENYVRISEVIFAQLMVKAKAEGRSVDQVAEDLLRENLLESWQEKSARWRKYGIASGIKADRVPDVVHDWPKQQRGR